MQETSQEASCDPDAALLLRQQSLLKFNKIHIIDDFFTAHSLDSGTSSLSNESGTDETAPLINNPAVDAEQVDASDAFLEL